MSEQPSESTLLISMIRDLQNNVKDLPSRSEFQNLLAELREYVRKDKHEADMLRLEIKIEDSAKHIGDLQKENSTRPRLGSWGQWFFPSIVTLIGICINLYIAHPILPAPSLSSPPAITSHVSR